MKEFSDNQRYSLEKAQKEAEELKRLIREGYATGYDKAEAQLMSSNARNTLNKAIDGLFADLRPLHEVIEEQQKADEAVARAKKLGRYNIYISEYKETNTKNIEKRFTNNTSDFDDDYKKEWD